jgi:hypothetical protein
VHEAETAEDEHDRGGDASDRIHGAEGVGVHRSKILHFMMGLRRPLFL